MESQRIKELRGRLGLSQERFAHLLGVSFQTVRRWEGGLTRPLPILSLRLEELQRESRSIPPAGSIPRAAREQGGARAELRLGGVLKGLGSLLDLVAKLSREGHEVAARSGQVEALGGQAQGVYGFSVRLGRGGSPVLEPFGNIQETADGPVVAETREPLLDLLDEGDHLTVIVELPGVEEGDIRLRLEGDILEVSAAARGRKYHKEVLLPVPVAPQSLQPSCRNGILELKLAKAS